MVSQAAWQAAIRRGPGILLIHYNSRHVMEKIITPGEVRTPLRDPSSHPCSHNHGTFLALLPGRQGSRPA
ncbi:hypothetical protein FJV76_13925 [Mesorhizobium sp. WSM4303]|nr:hypothetical protein FJV77_08035 [Mesorhizobium sp. WSM4306]TRD04363.1 hypothetical protein FJV76_13925 [Mesorhizobium sp. WSM4303]